MNRDDIIRMAKQASGSEWSIFQDFMPELERFAALVAAATRESMKSEGWRACAVGQLTTQHCGLLETAVLAEREACARVCDEEKLEACWHEDAHTVAAYLASVIRARGE